MEKFSGKAKATEGKVQRNIRVYFLLGLKQRYYGDLEIEAADFKLGFSWLTIK